MDKSQFQKLIDYYHQCVIEDREFKIAEKADPNNRSYKKTYMKLSQDHFQLFMSGKNFPPEGLTDFRRELRIDEKKEKEIEFLIGYPIYYNSSSKRIIPAFVFVVTDKKESVHVDYDDFHLNSVFFEENEIDLNSFRKEIENLNLTEPINGVKREVLSELLNLLKAFVVLDQNHDGSGKVFTDYAAFFTHEKSYFTKGLENELREISRRLKMSDDLISKSALKYLVDQENEKVNDVDEVTMFTNLNPSQMEAIKLAMSSGITNIQGPPGTGKSDVVINIVFNAFIQNKSILFSSKNHKAIETVLSRIERYLENIPFLLKLGKTDGQQDLGPLLMEKIEYVKSFNEFMPTENAELMDLQSKSKILSREIEELEKVQKTINEIRLDISESYRRYIKGTFNNLERMFSNLRKRQSIQSSAILSPRIKKMVKYNRAIQNAERLQRVEEITEQIFAKRYELVTINKAILHKTIKKSYASMDQKSRGLLSEYQRLLEFWVDNTFESPDHRRQFKEKFISIKKHLLTWSVSNLSISGQLPIEPGIFDYVIIDEASQCDIPSSLCLMIRAKSFIVVGDEKQLTHITNLNKKRRFQLFQQYFNLIDFNDWEYGGSSILNLIKSRTKNIDGKSEIMLNEHFRSKKEIISFSNSHFYRDKLRIRTDYLNLNSWKDDSPFSWIDIKGVYQAERFKLFVPEEVAECREVLLDLVNSENIKSIGIISPFRLQVEKLREACQPIVGKYEKEKDIVIDTITRFQGDEKDVIIFSLAVSNPIKLPNGRLVNNNEYFYTGNGNLINVGLTRAKSNLIIVGNKEYCKSSECNLLRRLSEYHEQKTTVNRHTPETNEEQILVTALNNEGFQPQCQYDFFAYRMDMALFENGKRLCIEVDGSQHEGAVPGSRNAYDNVRDYTMQREGWRVLRFWNYEVWHNLDKCVSRIKEEIAKAD